MTSIAIIGTGIAGLTCAYHLVRRNRVTVFEANDYIGGHTHTVDVDLGGQRIGIDTGFIVFNDRTYPNFIALLDELGVAYQPTEMSFSVRNDARDLEYNGHDVNTLFAQRRNLLSPPFLRMLIDITRFNRQVRRAASDDDQGTLGEFLHRHRFGALFADNYLLPMVAAIWSMGLDDVKNFPLRFFVSFFENHGLLNLLDRPQWYTITGGSRSYIDPLVAPFRSDIRINAPVRRVLRHLDGVTVTTDRGAERFDEVVFACHGNEALSLLGDPSDSERAVLGNIRFTDNNVILHTDQRLLPQSRRAWASWNYRIDADQGAKPTVTYNMNMLQRLDLPTTCLVTLNGVIDDRFVLGRYRYHHPAYDHDMINAQNRWAEISGVNRTHFCGAYWFNGFHEDGVRSALRVCRIRGDLS